MISPSDSSVERKKNQKRNMWKKRETKRYFLSRLKHLKLIDKKTVLNEKEVFVLN